jgi:hypothetical protein
MRVAVLSTDRGIAYGGAKGASVHLESLAAALAGEGRLVLIGGAAAVVIIGIAIGLVGKALTKR